jgi:pilus assembly protein FimV
MLLGSYPRLLVLALSLPEMSHALGLGNMRVESKLNEPLSAQIDIIGATPDELKAMSASVASPELFQRYNAERPAFLSSATLTVGTDASGKPVLNIQSADAFTEPLVEFLIDVRWGKQELVRDYSLLLDPPQVTPANTAPAAASSDDGTLPLAQPPAIEIPRILLASTAFSSAARAQLVLAADPVAVTTETQYRVIVHDTLRGIVLHLGARTEAEQQRMMLAIFQANQDAFAGNINRLHSGALITIPSAAEIQVFDSADVEREIRAQMSAWRRGGPASRRSVAPAEVAQFEPVVARAPVSQPAEVSAAFPAANTLDDQLQLLQRKLDETNRQLAIASARLSTMERRATQNVQVAATATAVQAKAAPGKTSFSALLWGLALLLGGLAYACRRFLSGRSLPRQPVRAEEPTIEVPVMPDMDSISVSAAPSVTEATDAYSVTESVPELVAPAAVADGGAPVDSESTDDESTMEMTQVVDINVDTVEEQVPGDGDEPDTVVLVTLESKAGEAHKTALDYNLSDLDGRPQHVEMPASLRDHAVVVERRKNVVDTLIAAIERDPTRNDLRMKLLETLHAAASTNLRAFKDVVRDVARNPGRLKAHEWEQVMAMGRQIAADDALFAEQAADDRVAKRA